MRAEGEGAGKGVAYAYEAYEAKKIKGRNCFVIHIAGFFSVMKCLRSKKRQNSSVTTTCVCVRAHTWGARKRVLITHPGGTQARADHDPCAHRPGPQHILLTRIAVPVQWRCRQSESRKSLHGRISWRPRVFQLLHLPSRTMECRARTTCCDWMRMIWWYCAAS